MTAQSWLNDIWYQRASPPWWLLPLASIYGAASGLRRWAYAHRFYRPTRLSRAVIVVGNLSVGGTGKTPLVCWLVEHLAARGLKPGVVTRGYRGSAQGERLVTAADDPEVVGDEALLLARRTQVPIAVGRNRPAAAQLLINAGCDVIVSDDGLQHYALARDGEVVVIDGERRFGNGRLLPAGPLRELPARLRSVDAIVLTGGSEASHGAMRMQLQASEAISLQHGTARPLNEFTGQWVHALAAIGNPQRFFTMLQAHGIKVLPHPLPDHARLRVEDICFDDDRAVLMTEKDAVKCAAIAGAQHWYVPISATFADADAAALLGIVGKIIQNRP